MKETPSKVAQIGPDPFISQSSPDHSPQPRIDFSYHEISGPDICSHICAPLCTVLSSFLSKVIISWPSIKMSASDFSGKHRFVALGSLIFLNPPTFVPKTFWICTWTMVYRYLLVHKFTSKFNVKLFKVKFSRTLQGYQWRGTSGQAMNTAATKFYFPKLR